MSTVINEQMIVSKHYEHKQKKKTDPSSEEIKPEAFRDETMREFVPHRELVFEKNLS